MNLSRGISMIILTGGLLAACSISTKEKLNDTTSDEVAIFEANPAGKNFNYAGSDTMAIELADQVMVAMGGRQAWNDTRYLAWNFFGARKLLWDKQTGDVRIDFLMQEVKILMNVRNMEGRAWQEGKELTQVDSVEKYLKRGKSVWINDSYWLVMPFKLKDSGVTLKYSRADTTLTGQSSDVLTMTFQDVGDTPDNKYEVWIDQESKLVTQWAYYGSRKDSVAAFTRPWGNYQQMGGILLSDDRGERDLTEVRVLTDVPEGTFSEFEEVVL